MSLWFVHEQVWKKKCLICHCARKKTGKFSTIYVFLCAQEGTISIQIDFLPNTNISKEVSLIPHFSTMSTNMIYFSWPLYRVKSAAWFSLMHVTDCFIILWWLSKIVTQHEQMRQMSANSVLRYRENTNQGENFSNLQYFFQMIFGKYSKYSLNLF